MKVLLLRNVSEERNLSMKLYADRIARALEGRCRVESHHPWSPPVGPRSRLGVAFKALDYFARYGAYPARAWRLRADVFHVVDHAYAHLLVALPARRTVVTSHDLMLLRLGNGDFGPGRSRHGVAWALLSFSVRFLRHAARVVAVSRATANDLVTRVGVPSERVRVVPHGVDPLFQPPPDAEARRQARERLGFGSEPVLLHVGNNWFYKNLEGILRALGLLVASEGAPTPLLVKVGKGLTPAQRALAASVGVAERVRELGVVSAAMLRQIYWAADALVFPSLWEGFGWPVLEAMASGLPVISSDCGALSEVAGDAAVVVKPEDPGDIAGGIRSVLGDDGLRKELAARGLERSRGFTWERVAVELRRLYEEVLQSAGSRL